MSNAHYLRPANPRIKLSPFAQNIRQVVLMRRSEIPVSNDDSRIRKTVDWLREVQNQNGSWGHNNVAATSLTVLVLSSLVDSMGRSDLPEQVRRCLEAARDFLAAAYARNQYERAPWDTAVALRALTRCPESPIDLTRELTGWLLSLDPAAINAGPHHLAQRTLALADRGANRDRIEASALATAQRVEAGKYAFSPYVLAQCAEAVRLANPSVALEPYEKQLRMYLRSANLDSANFINICTALKALSSARSYADTEDLRLSVASLFGETCFRDDGTWYHDELCTAWALLALTQFSTEVIIRAPKNELVHDIEDSIRQFEDVALEFIRTRDRTWVFHLAMTLLVGLLLGVFITYSSTKGQFPQWLAWAIPFTIAGIATMTAQFVIRVLGVRRGGSRD